MGYADDGGMLLPETIPVIGSRNDDNKDESIKEEEVVKETLRKWAALDYPHLVVEVIKVSSSGWRGGTESHFTGF